MTQQEFQQRYEYNHATDKLGEGGFGSVFKAYDTFRDRRVALKIAKVLPGFESVRLKKEVEMVNALPVHPNIAYYEECYTFPSFDGEYDFAVMQFYKEGSLMQLLKNELTEEQKQSILKQILQGLSFLHEHGIIHRDLKPQNVLIAKRQDGSFIPKITDFGISKKLDENKSALFSNSLVGAGTLSYSSPEQLGEREIRKNTDLWSLGVIAFQIFTGKLPFSTGAHANTSEAGRIELFSQINRCELPEEINTIPETWQTLIRQCLITNSEKRIRNCSEALDILEGKITVEPLHATPLQEDKTLIEGIIPKTDDKTIIEKPQLAEKVEKPPFKMPDLKVPLMVAGGVAIGLLVWWLLAGQKPDKPDKQTELIAVADSLAIAREYKFALDKYNEAFALDTTNIELKNKIAVTAQLSDSVYTEYLKRADNAAKMAKELNDTEYYQDALNFYKKALLYKDDENTKKLIVYTETAMANVDKKVKQETVEVKKQETQKENDCEEKLEAANKLLNKKEYEKAKGMFLELRNKGCFTDAYIKQFIQKCDAGLAKAEQSSNHLTNYDLDTQTAFGSYMTVQRKSDKKWGIIDKNGNEKCAFVYDQSSSLLKNNYIALKKRGQNWDVYNSSASKVETNVEFLDEYK